jgi:hypothetical protein
LKNLVENRYDSLGVRGAFDVLSLSGAILVVVGTVPRTGAADLRYSGKISVSNTTAQSGQLNYFPGCMNILAQLAWQDQLPSSPTRKCAKRNMPQQISSFLIRKS